MKGKYLTVYTTSYGIVKAVFLDELTFDEAERLGKEYCEKNNYEFLGTEEAEAEEE